MNATSVSPRTSIHNCVLHVRRALASLLPACAVPLMLRTHMQTGKRS